MEADLLTPTAQWTKTCAGQEKKKMTVTLKHKLRDTEIVFWIR